MYHFVSCQSELRGGGVLGLTALLNIINISMYIYQCILHNKSNVGWALLALFASIAIPIKLFLLLILAVKVLIVRFGTQDIGRSDQVMANRGGATRPNGPNAGNKICQFKLVLLGESAVGKSSLVLRFVKGQFHEFQESTIGGELHINRPSQVLIKHILLLSKQFADYFEFRVGALI